MMDNGLEVPFQVRDLAATSLDNIEKAFALFFDAATRSIAPNSAETIALLERVISVKIDYARKISLAKDLTEATALQFAYCRSQVQITTDLIRIASDSIASRPADN
ncbi:hypothetical protein IVA95_15435 [Bradyrhizobium sp. 157]|uniref:hypothetical protein n=1 Tax=Bradyrhizobium sp. 157 TaxID=2782631 RepID=UPI001FF9BB00|nr:hypothetical protein [Bradyrhizobium sp. 157]MCK1638955.1 hypothetical protein [Bradyrhizobium sp. 157]